MKNYKIRSYCKINLFLKITKKLKNNYHNLLSLITFCELHDLIKISSFHGKKDIINFSGRFKGKIDKKSNTISKILNLLRKKNLLNKKFFKINIIKNIPHGSGLGGGSSNAAYLLKYLNNKYKLKISNKTIKKIARQVGFDVPIFLEKKNSLLTGKKDEIIRLKQKYKFNLLIVFPNFICSTKKIYQANKNISLIKNYSSFFIKDKERIIDVLKNQGNDLEKPAIKIYPKIKEVINVIESQKGCYFSRISGSGSACFGIFVKKKNAVYAQKMIKLKYPKYWSVVSKTI